MTSVPPEPPAGFDPSASTPPTPPPATQQWSAPPPAQQPASSGGGFNPAAVDRLDWGILAAGLLALIFSTFSYYTASYHGYSASVGAWHGFFGWFAALIALFASILLAVHIVVPSVQLPVPVRLTVLGGYALAALCVILAGLIDGATVLSPASSGRGVGYYLSLVVILA